MKRLLVALALVACSDPTGIGLPSGAVPMNPPDGYADLFRGIGDCSTGRSDWQRIHWFQVAGAMVDGQHRGLFIPPDTIIVASDQAWNPGDGFLTPRHEMLHFRIGGDPQHGSAAWDACRV